MPIGRHLCALSLAATLTTGCNSADVGGGDGQGSGSQADAATMPEPAVDASLLPDVDGAPADASAPDPRLLILSQSNSLDIVGGVSVACFEAVNSYYRVFDLAALGIEDDVRITKVTFGVEECVSGGVGLPATVILSSLEGPFVLANLTRLASARTVIPDVAIPPDGQLGGRLHEVAIDGIVPGGSVLVVELTHRAFDEDQSLLVGSNRANDDDETYLRAPACDVNEPQLASAIEDEDGDPVEMNWVLVVEGET